MFMIAYSKRDDLSLARVRSVVKLFGRGMVFCAFMVYLGLLKKLPIDDLGKENGG